ncbi:MAG: hypothetical protein LHV69_02445 [Elusimicrobia bacterium]|nr:hypothetical protein [Candidatus Obscuribacterium magneticum]MCB4755883.1 hypothetical protein [Candidatus Obscuribacterium magneticum]
MYFLFFALGFYATVSQVILFRELAAVFLGHEMAFGVSLAAWLLWGGWGSRSHRRTDNPQRTFLITLSLIGIVVPLTALLIRVSKLFTPAGHIPGLIPSLFFPFLLMALPCWLLGASFALGTKVPNKSAGLIYAFESAGAFAGGLAVTSLFLGRFPAFFILTAGGAALVLAVTLFSFSRLFVVIPAKAGIQALNSLSKRKFTDWIPAFAGMTALDTSPKTLVLIMMSMSVALTIFTHRIDALARRLQYKDYEVLSHVETRYENSTLVQLDKLNILFQNGVLATQFPDPAAEEEMVHWPLLAHPQPQRVLALGLGALPAVKEIFKHPVGQLEVVDPDELAFTWLSPFIRPFQKRALDDARFNYRPADGRAWIKQHAQTYDIILQTLGDPVNAQRNRFFTKEFFTAAKEALKPGGLLAFSISSSENYLPPEVALANASLFKTVAAVFPRVEILHGSRMILLASETPISLDPALLIGRYEKRHLKNKILVPELLPYSLLPERRSAAKKRIEEFPRAPVNSDLSPISHVLVWRVWLAKFIAPIYFLGPLIIVFILAWMTSRVWRIRRDWARHKSELLLFSMGFSGMILEVAILLLFQALSGALYWQMGLLFSSFMLGLAGGSGLSAKVTWNKPSLLLNGLTLSLGAYSFAGWFLIQKTSFLPESALGFCMGLFIPGVMIGAAYPIAAQIEAGRAAQLYAADLWGSALGAFLAGSCLIPLLGQPTTFLVSGLALVGSVFIAGGMSALRKRPS